MGKYDNDINKMQEFLRFSKREDLAEILEESTSDLWVSENFGHSYFSYLSEFKIFSPIENFRKINELSKEDKKVLIDSVTIIYPPISDSPEIEKVSFYPQLLNTDRDESMILGNNSFDYRKKQFEELYDLYIDGDYENLVKNIINYLKTLCKLVIERYYQNPDHFGDNLFELYKIVSKLLYMAPNDYEDNNSRNIVSPFTNIVQALSEFDLTSINSDTIEPRIATIIYNFADAISDYIIDSFDKQNNIHL